MTTEEAIEGLSLLKIFGAPDLVDAVEMAVAALRTQQEAEKNEPLTLEELRELPIIESWMWIEVLKPDAFRSELAVSAYYRKQAGCKPDEEFWCGYPGLSFTFDYADYGKTWLAYRHKPKEDRH